MWVRFRRVARIYARIYVVYKCLIIDHASYIHSIHNVYLHVCMLYTPYCMCSHIHTCACTYVHTVLLRTYIICTYVYVYSVHVRTHALLVMCLRMCSTMYYHTNHLWANGCTPHAAYVLLECAVLSTSLRAANGNRYEGSWEDDMKNGDGRFFYLDKGQKFTGFWVNDVAKCGTMEDSDRDSAPQPPKYPIPEVRAPMRRRLQI